MEGRGIGGRLVEMALFYGGAVTRSVIHSVSFRSLLYLKSTKDFSFVRCYEIYLIRFFWVGWLSSAEVCGVIFLPVGVLWRGSLPHTAFVSYKAADTVTISEKAGLFTAVSDLQRT